MVADNTIFDKSYKEMTYSIKVISIIATSILILVECGVLLTKIIYGTIGTAQDLLDYVNRYIATAAGIIVLFDIIMLVAKKLAIRSGRFDDNRAKRVFSLSHLCILASTIVFIHYRLESVYAAPIIVVFMSVVYADKVVTVLASMYCSVAVTVGTLINIEINNNNLPLDWYISYAIAILLYFLTALVANKLIDIEQFKEKEQKKAHDKIDEVVINADLDALTRIWNYAKIEKLLKDKSFTKPGLKIAMIDVDNFKNANDLYGHDFGNVVLRRLANVLRGIQDSSTYVARYGGEEFAVLASARVPADKFVRALEKVRKEFSEQEYDELTDNTHFTISVGWAELDGTVEHYKERMGVECLKLADKALYVAKRSTKNRVVRFCEKEVYTAVELFGSYCDYKKDASQFSRQHIEEIKEVFEQIDKLNLDLETLEEYREALNVVLEETRRASETLFLLDSEVENLESD